MPRLVASRADAWIETMGSHRLLSAEMSRPARTRGLKLHADAECGHLLLVASRADAWIETMLPPQICAC